MRKLILLILLLPLFVRAQAPTSDSTIFTAPPVTNPFSPQFRYSGGNASNLRVGFYNTLTSKWGQLVTGYQFNQYIGTATQAAITAIGSGYVPYTGATSNLNLGSHTMTALSFTGAGTGLTGTGASFTSGNSTLWNGYALNISGLATNDILQYNGTQWQNVINTYSSPLLHSAGNTSIQVANTSQSGYLTATDWNTFNGKAPALGFTAEDVANKTATQSLSTTTYPNWLGVTNYITGLGYGTGTVTSITPGYGHTSVTPITTSGTIAIDTTAAMVSKTFFNGKIGTGVATALSGKQATLVSGTNIKTINGATLLGSTNILLQTPLVAGTDYLTPTGSAAGLTSFPTFNQNTTGTASNVTGIVLGANGGTGIANTGKTITLGGNLTTSGAFGTTLTTTGITNVTLPTTGTLGTLAGTEVFTNKDLTSGTNTFPTFNQNTTGSAAKWTTARNLAGNSVDGSVNVNFSNKFIVQGTADAGLTGAQFLGGLGTGLVKNTTTTGILSIATSGTDYQAPISLTTTGASGASTFVTNTLNIPTYTLTGLGGVPTTTTVNGKALSGNITLGLASADFANQGTTATVLHGNATGNPSFGAVSLTTDVTGLLPDANISSAAAWNAKQSPITFGTGVQTALGVNIGTAGSPVVNGGTLGTPSSGIATNLTGTATTLNIGGNAATSTTAGTVTTAAQPTITSVGTLTGLTVTAPIAGSVTGTAASFTGSLAGDVTGGQATTVVGKINGVSMAGLATGILKNTTTTGVPSIAIAADFPTLNQSTTGNAATATLASTVTTNANLTGEVTSVGNAATLTNSAVIGKVLTGYVSGSGTVAATDNILQAFQKINGNQVLDASNISTNTTNISTSATNITTLFNRNISTSTGLTGGGNLSADRTLKADTTVLQTVLNLKPLGSTYWLSKTATTLPSTFVSSSLTSVGTIGTGVWQGTAIGDTYISSAPAWNTASSQTRQWNGGATGLVAATGRTSLGLVIGTDVLAYRTFGTAANNNTGDFEVPLTFNNGLSRSVNTISPTYGTAANTFAQGNDSRINNGQTAFGWGNPSGVYLPLSAGVGNPVTGDLYISTNKNIFLGSGTGNNQLNINSLSGSQGLVNYYSSGTQKWTTGKQTDDSYIIYNNTLSAYALQIDNTTNVINAPKIQTPQVPATGNDIVNKTALDAAVAGFVPNSAQTTVGGSVSGSIIASMPFQGSTYKKVLIYVNSVNGTATYTYPTAFTVSPSTFTPGTGVTLTPSTTSVIVTAAGGFNGFVILEGY